MNKTDKTYKVNLMTRVEGEGKFRLRVSEGEVVEATLSIFEAPRFFEAMLQGRSMYEVPDIVARICGICPVAYQVSAVRAIEDLLGLSPPEGSWPLRRLLYCGEWIESHALHIHLLHAPDFLGYENAIAMAADHRHHVERGIRMRRLGNELMAVLGGRAVHPVSLRIGGFTRTPRKVELRDIRNQLEAGLEDAEETVDFCAGLPMPDFEEDYISVSLEDKAYPIEYGHGVAITGQDSIGLDEFEEHFSEQQVPHSTALQSRMRDGRSYLVGPVARINHFAELLHPRAQAALERSKLALPVRNPYRSITVRAIEMLHAYAEAIDLIDAYTDIDPAWHEPSQLRAGTGFGATEAPRGICWHRYDLNADGTVAAARIVPPTAQNQARIEEDLVDLVPLLLKEDHDKATLLCEQLIRNYDPCISCSTHFLKLDLQEVAAKSQERG